MVFGGTAARSSAIPTPSEGMTSYRTDTQQIESYDGAEWRGMSGLQLVKKQTIGTGVSSVAVTGAFSATYDNYKIVISGGVANTTGFMALQLGSTTSGYYGAYTSIIFGNSTLNAGATNNGAAFNQAGFCTGTFVNFNIDVINPFLSHRTMIDGGFISNSTAGSLGGFQDSATSFTGFTVTPISGATSLTGGTIYVYGYGA